MKKILRRLKLNNSGVGIAMMIVAVGLTTILVSVLLMISTLNYKMKTTELQAKENFYNAEEILDQIQTGIRAEATKSAVAAYSQVIQTYKLVDESTRVLNFQHTYIENLEKALSKTHSADDTYYVGGLATDGADNEYIGGLFTQGLAKYVDTEVAGMIKSGSVRISYKGITTTNDMTGEITPQRIGTIKTESTGIVLEGVTVEYTDSTGYYTNISTDIAIGFPDISLSDSSTLPNALNYAMIADTGIVAHQTNSTSIFGSTYAGPEGVKVEEGSRLVVDEAKYFVTAGDLTIDSTSNYYMAGGELWARNIDITGVAAATSISEAHEALHLDSTSTYVADDLTISGKGSKAYLRYGNYYGYGSPALYGGNNALFTGDTNTATASNTSSAIVLNCIDSEVDMSSVENLYIFGNAYIDGKVEEGTPLYFEEGGVNKNENAQVLIGNSLTIKSDQIVYLAPSECLLTDTNTISVGRNPMSETDYNNWNKKISITNNTSLLGKPLSDYGVGELDYKVIWQQVGGKNVVYVFLSMSDENAAKYYRDYQSKASDVLNGYATKYNNIVKTTVDGNALTNGNIPNIAKNGSTMVLVPKTSTDMDILQEMQKNYWNKYRALCCKLSLSYGSLQTAEKARSVFDNLVDSSTITGSTLVTSGLTDETKVYALVTNANVTISAGGKVSDGTNNDIPANKVRLIITKGDVTVNSNYQGLILADGKLTLGNGANKVGIWSEGETTVDVVRSDIRRLLKTKVSGDEDADTLIATFFINGSNYALSDSTASTDAYVNFDDLVVFRNWIKQ